MRFFHILFAAAILCIVAFCISLRGGNSEYVKKVVLRVKSRGEGLVYLNGTPINNLEASLARGVKLSFSAKPAKGWRFAYWVVNNSKLVERNLTLVLRGETRVTAVFKKLKCTLRIISNISDRAYVNGKEEALPFESKYSCGETVTIAPAHIKGFRPLNFTTAIVLNRNLTASLLYVRERVDECEKGILITSNVARWILVNGWNVTLPYCAKPPAVIQGAFEMPHNGTHSWWLGWYWVRSASRHAYWWSHGINGSILYVDEPAEVKVHYLLGLKGLPYVVRIWNYSSYGYKTGIFQYKLQDNKVTFYVTPGRHAFYGFEGLLEFSSDIRLMEVNVEFDVFKDFGQTLSVGVIYLEGDKMSRLPVLGVSPNPYGVTRVMLNVSVFRMAWVKWKSWDKRYEFASNVSEPYISLFLYNPSYWVFWGKRLHTSWREGVFLTPLTRLTYPSPNAPFERLPDTGNPAIWLDFCSESNFEKASVWIGGVAP